MGYYWPNFVFGTFGDDVVGGTKHRDWIFGFWGNDLISAMDGRDFVNAGAGNDTIDPGAGRDTVIAGKGDDLIIGSADDDKIFGGRGFDIVSYEGGIADYEISDPKGRALKTTVTSLSDDAGDAGRDRLWQVEALYFAGDDYTFFLDGTNNAVLAGDDLVETTEDTSLDISVADLLANDREFDGDAISIMSVDATSAAGASVTLSDGVVCYSPGDLFDALGTGDMAEDTFSYTVDDGKGGTDTARVTVKIMGVNDGPVLVATEAVTVDENTTDVAANVSATDVEGDALTFSLTGVDAGFFDIDSGTGVISFVDAPDFETPLDDGADNVYDITVNVADPDGAADTQDITVTVADVFEAPPVVARINEFHYDNAGSDTGEFIEVRVEAGGDASNLLIELYNGNGGAVYNSVAVDSGTKTTDGMHDYYVLAIAGIQNGSPDGIALSNAGALIEFLSYEGDMIGVGGAADGAASTDIGVSEPGDTPVGFSLQRNEDGTWREPELNTGGAENVPVEVITARINEFHYDNLGADVGEFVEVRLDAGEDASDLLIEFYNGNGGAVYASVAVDSGTMTSDGTHDYYVLDVAGIQNGGPDGLALSRSGALIEFLSYEGSFTGVGGAADGVSSDNIGVSEPSDTPQGQSLQRNDDGTWRAAEPETRGAENIPNAPVTARINEFHYDNVSGDVDEFVEIRLAAGEDASGLLLELYNGSNGAIYATRDVSAGAFSTDGTFDYYVLEITGIQNGSPDGLALSKSGTLIEFLSYEGSLTGVGGVADGVTSQDIGVAEASDTPVGQSLQRNDDGTWRAPEDNTKGGSNNPVEVIEPRINEFHYDNISTDVGEFIEVRVALDTDVSLMQIDLYNGSNNAVYRTLDVSVGAKTSDATYDYYVLDVAGLQNGSRDGIALSDDGVLIEFLSYEGTLVGSGGPASGVNSVDVGVTEDAGTPVGFSLQRFDDGTWGAAAVETRGAANAPGEPPLDVTLISEIQGVGGDSPLLGQEVTVSAVVTHVVSNGYYLQEEDADADADVATSEGIFVFSGSIPGVSVGNRVLVSGLVDEFFGATQIDTVTSEIIEVASVELPTAAEIILSPDTAQDFEAVEGMQVVVTSGTPDPLTVIENFNFDRFGEITISAGRQVQATQLFDAQTEAADVAATLEGNLNNRLTLDDGVASQNPDEFLYVPGGAGDNGNGFLDAGDDFGDAGSTLRLGSEMTAPVEGVMSFNFGEYKLVVTETLPIDAATNVGARQNTPDDVGGDVQVASINVLNYFTTLDEGGAGTGPGGDLGPRGADTASELARQQAKLVEAFLASGAEVFAIQEIENNGFGTGSAIATLVDALNAEVVGSDPFAFVDPTTDAGFIGTDAITTGLIYNSAVLNLVTSDFLVYDEASAATTFALAEVLNQVASSDDQVGDFQRNRPTVAATFEDARTGETFTVASSHYKSKGDSNLQDVVRDAEAHLAGGGTTITQADIDALLADGNYDQGDGQGFWNAVRLDGAVELEEWIRTEYAGTGVTDYLLLGDMNAYAKEDPVQHLGDQGLVDLIDRYIGQDDAYSFVFDGQQGTLDQGFSDLELAVHVTGATEWHINADEPDLINYDESFNNPDFFNDGVYASSDHDPLIIGLQFLPDIVLG